jgi:membrane protein implicated in regulation of membrane protease activity
MESFLNPAVIWFIIGFLFFLLEFAVPGFILFFFGLGAWVVAAMTLFMDLSIDIQVFVFLGSSLLTVLVFRKWVRAKLGMKKASGDLLHDEIIGKTGKAETQILPGKQGKVFLRGTGWNAVSSDTVLIETGDDVIIVGHDSNVLIVKSTNH